MLHRLCCALVAASCLAGCNMPELGAAHESPQYQFERNSRGQLLRLDTRTGDIIVVESPSATSAKRSARGEPRKALPAVAHVATPSQPRADLATTSQPRQIEVAVPLAAENAIPAVASCAPSAELPDAVTAQVPTDVFVRPGATASPLATLPAGNRVNVLAAEGEWLLVQFDDREWGQRAGYVHCSSTTQR